MKRSSGKIWTGLISLGVILTIALVFLPPAALGIEYSFATINMPGVEGTVAYGINDFGNIVGAFDGQYGFLNVGAKFKPIGIPGALYSSMGGSFTTIDPPGSSGSIAYGINNNGDIVGFYGLPTLPGHAFEGRGFLDVGGNFTTIDFQGAPETRAQGINDFGNIVGYGRFGTRNDGFLYVGGNFTTINFPGAQFTEAFDINNSGNIVGGYSNAGEFHGFLYVGGNFTTIDPPGSSGSIAYGINNYGDIVGYYVDATGHYHGFLDVGGNFTPIDVPFAIYTMAFGINDSGNIVGVGQSVAEPSTMLLLGSGLIGLAGYGRKKFFKK